MINGYSKQRMEDIVSVCLCRQLSHFNCKNCVKAEDCENVKKIFKVEKPMDIDVNKLFDNGGRKNEKVDKRNKNN